ncbi:Cysteine-rich secretory protein family protein [Nakamurella panacisegetis]|uniref:Cysteine-rich secretory protein family protein n=1 Tax=Nakamurella panacisegetis TaxID=1090615 RepID=A0A1H0PGM9_9ACTN|nr:Cysteine-rich secretory protein family protein [Nakamurella panacisegetis]
MHNGKERVRARLLRLTAMVGATALAAVAVVAPADAAAPAPAAVIAPAAASAQMVSFDQQMITLINGARVKAGVGALTEAKGLTSLAVWWSNQMSNGATSYNLAHNPNAWTMVTQYGASNRTSWGENVAWSSSTATTAQQIFTAYMNSPGHKANILSSSFHYVGMGTVGGTHGLFNTTEFTDKVEAGQAVAPAPVTTTVVNNGDFIRDVVGPAVYVVVGGAPVYVSSWAPFGGVKRVKLVTDVTFKKLRQYPADGTFIRTPGSGAVYRIAGGAPLYVSSWAPFGGPKPVLNVDPAAVAKAGQAGWYSHLRWQPADNTLIKGGSAPKIYRVMGGKATWLTSWSLVGGPKPFTVVDPKAITLAGSNTFYAHLAK